MARLRSEEAWAGRISGSLGKADLAANFTIDDGGEDTGIVSRKTYEMPGGWAEHFNGQDKYNPAYSMEREAALAKAEMAALVREERITRRMEAKADIAREPKDASNALGVTPELDRCVKLNEKMENLPRREEHEWTQEEIDKLPMGTYLNEDEMDPAWRAKLAAESRSAAQNNGAGTPEAEHGPAMGKKDDIPWGIIFEEEGMDPEVREKLAAAGHLLTLEEQRAVAANPELEMERSTAREYDPGEFDEQEAEPGKAAAVENSHGVRGEESMEGRGIDTSEFDGIPFDEGEQTPAKAESPYAAGEQTQGQESAREEEAEHRGFRR